MTSRAAQALLLRCTPPPGWLARRWLPRCGPDRETMALLRDLVEIDKDGRDLSRVAAGREPQIWPSQVGVGGHVELTTDLTFVEGMQRSTAPGVSSLLDWLDDLRNSVAVEPSS